MTQSLSVNEGYMKVSHRFFHAGARKRYRVNSGLGNVKHSSVDQLGDGLSHER